MKLKILFFFIPALFSLSSVANEEQHSHDFPKDISELHDVMAPLWHAESGDERTRSTCDSIETMKTIATKIEGSEKLVMSLNDLSNNCDKGNKSFDDAFILVHDAFHGVSDKAKK